MTRQLLRSTAVVGGMTLVSRVLGLLRDMVVARIFGAGAGADAFFVAFRIPNFLRRLFAEGSFSQAFVPVLSQYKAKQSHEEVKYLVDATVGALGGILFAVTAIGVLASPLLVMVFAPGFIDDAPKYDLAVAMVRLTFPYLLFISLTALAGGILNTYGNFGVPAFTPVFLNLSMIGAALWLAPHMAEPVMALAWGVFIAGAVQLAFQAPYLLRLRLMPRPRWDLANQGVRRIGRLMLPGIFGSSVAQINLLIDTLIASFLVTGSVSWLYFSDRLVEFPLGVFGIALATVILPKLSQHHANQSTEAHSRTVDWALRMVIVIGTPATVGLMVLAGPLLITLFHYGEFDAEDVRMARLSLIAFSLGLLAYILIKVLAAAYYSRQDTRTPVRIGVIAMVSNVVLNLALVVPMVRMGIPGPHAGLALATSLSAFLNAGLLYRGLRRAGVLRHQPGWLPLICQVFAACAAMAAVLLLVSGELSRWLELGWAGRVAELCVAMAAGVAVYFGVLWGTGLRVRHLRLSAGEG
jgi:putative peptidoglycan lipid II flippase